MSNPVMNDPRNSMNTWNETSGDTCATSATTSRYAATVNTLCGYVMLYSNKFNMHWFDSILEMTNLKRLRNSQISTVVFLVHLIFLQSCCDPWLTTSWLRKGRGLQSRWSCSLQLSWGSMQLHSCGAWGKVLTSQLNITCSECTIRQLLIMQDG